VSVRCPQGHESEATDYCDACGARIAPRADVAGPVPEPEPASDLTPPPTPTADEPVAPLPPCPACGTPRVGDDRFCEACGHDFTAPAQPAAGWSVVVTADRGYYDRIAPVGIDFPAATADRAFLLTTELVRIGRRSASRGVPEIDLTHPVEDRAVSHLHAVLRRQPDGSYVLVDPGSTNGTMLNDDPTPILHDEPVALGDGDCIHLGAWTTITIRARATDG
jgi:hypothetical protein